MIPRPSDKEYKRLEVRVRKYLKYALVHSKPTKELIDSTIMFIEGERQRAALNPVYLTKWDHFKELFK
jgi:hypothetical protein